MSRVFGGETAVITISSSDTVSAAADLHGICDFMRIVIPIQTSADLSFQVSEDGANFYSLANGKTVAAGTGNYTTTIRLGGWRYVKVISSAGQAADRTYAVKGWSN